MGGLLSIYDESLHLCVQQLTREANVDCSLDLVPSEDPDLDASSLDKLKRVSDLILEFVFDGSRANQIEVDLNLLRDFVHVFLSIACRGQSSLVLLAPLPVEVL